MASASIVVVAVLALLAVFSPRAQGAATRGVVDPQIIGGSDAALGEFPHQVSLQKSFLFIQEQHVCGGTIISEKWVLTAAHCVMQQEWLSSFFILAGKSKLREKEAGQQRSAVKKIYSHENFLKVKNARDYDIALLLLKTPLKFTDTVKPAKLPQNGAIPTGSGIITGWGSIGTTNVIVKPKQLQKLNIPIIPYAECHAWWQEQADAEGATNPLAESNVCVGSLTNKGQGACKGDSGGPLIQYDSNGDAVVIGATSYGGFPCQNEATPTVYTRVSAHIDWINTKMSLH